MVTNMLNLPKLNILDMTESEDDYRFLVETTSPPPSYCPKCGTVPNLYKHGKKNQLFFDLPMHAKRVGILIKRQRYKCRECNETFFEMLPYMDDSRSVTKRLIKWIEQTSLKKPFTNVAEDIGVNEKTVRNIFQEYVARLDQKQDIKAPKWLGIDEVHLLRNYRCVITDVENRTVVDLLRNRNQDTVIRYLSQLSNHSRIKYVAMDMWNPYRRAVHTVIPNATVVIDKFHVVKMANEALEKIRKANRENITAKERRQLKKDRYVLLTRKSELNDFDDQLKLQIWTDNFPLLGIGYELKERFFDIYEAESMDEAYQLYQSWLTEIPKELMPYFDPLIKSMTNWEEEIFNYFNVSITNAYTESLNRLIKTMNHVGRGYSFEALRAKILFTQGYRKTKKKKKFKEVSTTFDKMYDLRNIPLRPPTFKWVYEKVYGADISTLTKAMEEGSF
ncbi:transposase [Evansella vedderi]|uniref:Transposase n=1 Tax=Evansella vedderi TaxID=38282 RepID=A0ABT9ZWE9_9BACI|nr:ISL3 family transposase [Evansella vedderi]MDQ0255562.1 transposase [Evansella vedderi]